MRQKVLQIGKVRIGGELGEVPIALIGSIFYSHHNIVKDADKGYFDKREAKKLIEKQQELSDNYNIGSILDVVAETPEAMERYLDFVAEIFEGPIILDGYLSARKDGIKYANEIGILDRVIYNSISSTNTDKELDIIKVFKVKNAILFAFDPHSTTSSARISLLSGTKEKKGLLQVAMDLDIENLLIDNVSTDIASIGDVIESNIMTKTAFGLPVGCGPANVTYYMSDILKKDLRDEILISSLNSLVHLFSDFLLYGPIEQASIAFESAYIVEEVKSNMHLKFYDIFKP